MAVALEGVDLVALAACFLLIGLLAAVSYTFTRLSSVLDVSILGFHPFSGIASAIRNTIVAGCNDGIAVLQSAVHDLWAGLEWSISETMKGLTAFADAVYTTFNLARRVWIPNFVSAIATPIGVAVTNLKNYVQSFTGFVAGEVTDLDNRITATASQLYDTLHREITNATANAERYADGQIASARTAIEADIAHGVSVAEGLASDAVGTLRAAENAAVSAVATAEDATAEELRDFINSVPLTDIAAVIAAFPLLKALVQTIEAESGLDSANCRSKVKQICGTSGFGWSKLLGLLSLESEWPGLGELTQGIADMTAEIVDAIEAMVT